MQDKKEHFSDMNCEEMAMELSGYACFTLSKNDIATMQFGSIASMAPIHEVAVSKAETKSALTIYNLFHCKCVDNEKKPSTASYQFK